MHSSFALTALLAAAAIAAPWGAPGSDSYGGDDCDDSSSARPAPTGTKSHQSHSAVSVSSISPTSSLQAIELAAHGTLPDGALPTKISDTTQITLEIIATTELFESAFFEQLISNITNNKPGFELKEIRDTVLRDLTAIHAQEQLHAIGANGILASAGKPTIAPCQYLFPINSFSDALNFITLETDVVLGTLQEVLTTFATDGDSELVGLIGSIVGQEGEQNGWFRSRLHKIPSALPFLTAASGAFAYTALNQNGIVAGTCPNGTAIASAGIPIFKPLTLDTKVNAATTSIEFSVSSTLASNTSIVYINQQNTPVTVKISDVKTANGKTTFTAPFPYNEFEMNGLTIAAVVNGSGNFTSAANVAMNTVFGPGFIEIN